MNDQLASNMTQNRRPHTVYVSDEVWAALERRHLELRLATAASPSKIEFVEQVLSAGLDVFTPMSGKRRLPEKASGSSVSKAAAERASDVPRTKDAKTPAGISPPRAARAKTMPRRSGAMERLLQASDPGRPAPIQSAAGSTGGTGG